MSLADASGDSTVPVATHCFSCGKPAPEPRQVHYWYCQECWKKTGIPHIMEYEKESMEGKR